MTHHRRIEGLGWYALLLCVWPAGGLGLVEGVHSKNVATLNGAQQEPCHFHYLGAIPWIPPQ
jgi:hypothetical protein